MTTPDLKDRKALVNEFVRRMITYTDEVTWFGQNSVMRGWAEATGGLASGAHRLYTAALRRYTMSNASAASLTVVAAERGAERLPATRSRTMVVFAPYSVNVDDIRDVSGDDYIEVDDSTPFTATDSIRVRSADGSTTEVVTLASISVGTGLVNGNDELVITGGLANSYAPTTEDVDVLLRATLAAGTQVRSADGVVFELTEPVNLADRNPVLDGEASSLALSDKGWAECTERGTVGNVGANTITTLVTPNAKVKSLSNPEPARLGEDEENDTDLRYRAAHLPTLSNQETLSWVEALCIAANSDVLRAIRAPGTEIRTMEVEVLKRTAASFSAAELTALNEYANERVRSALLVNAVNMTLTSVSVEADITLEPDASLEAAWRSAADALASFLDFRTWDFGVDVDDADLLTLVNVADGVANVDSSTFLPAADVAVGDRSLPHLVSLKLTDTTSGDVINATLSTAF